MAHLPVVAIICKIHFGPDQENPAVQTDDSAVVSDISVLNGHLHMSVFTTLKSHICCSYFQCPAECHCRTHQSESFLAFPSMLGIDPVLYFSILAM